ncbi:unnamed protein product [Miscanthus lutarioriparius]|uniref:Uncharacterized protein n=1 Tax=Miscanthus lutarioriparius TaxID=422564 RepID=A0A811NLZ9_9POAL|nr:unnamed protein product [Miscanthus lutarioriparius]
MEESISSSRTSAFYGNSYYSHHRHQQSPALAPASVAAAATSDFEDADSGWTAYFLQLASDEEKDGSASNREKQQLRDVGGVLICGRGSASTSTVSKPNKAKDNKEAVKKGVKKTKDEVLHLVRTTGILEEEDPLQDTASSPLVQLNINGDLQLLQYIARYDTTNRAKMKKTKEDVSY